MSQEPLWTHTIDRLRQALASVEGSSDKEPLVLELAWRIRYVDYREAYRLLSEISPATPVAMAQADLTRRALDADHSLFSVALLHEADPVWAIRELAYLVWCEIAALHWDVAVTLERDLARRIDELEQNCPNGERALLWHVQGMLALHARDTDKGIEVFRLAALEAAATGQASFEAVLLSCMAFGFELAMRHDEAVHCLHEALDLAHRSTRPAWMVGQTLGTIANIYWVHGSVDMAYTYARWAIDAERESIPYAPHVACRIRGIAIAVDLRNARLKLARQVIDAWPSVDEGALLVEHQRRVCLARWEVEAGDFESARRRLLTVEAEHLIMPEDLMLAWARLHARQNAHQAVVDTFDPAALKGDAIMRLPPLAWAVEDRARSLRALSREGEAKELEDELAAEGRDPIGSEQARAELLMRSVHRRPAGADVRSGIAQSSFGAAERRRMLGLTTASVAHNLNNVLMVAVTEISRLEWRADLEPETRDAISRAVSMMTSVGKVTRSLMRVVDGQSPPSERFDLRISIEEMQPVLEAAAGDGVRVELDLAAEPCFVEGNQDDVLEILLNLVVNARRAMEDRGQATVAVRGDGDWVRVCVDDSGPGVPLALRRAVFEPFFSTRSLQGGNGLGLPSVRKMVEQMQGYVWIEDGPQGASFRLRLPRA